MVRSFPTSSFYVCVHCKLILWMCIINVGRRTISMTTQTEEHHPKETGEGEGTAAPPKRKGGGNDAKKLHHPKRKNGGKHHPQRKGTKAPPPPKKRRRKAAPLRWRQKNSTAFWRKRKGRKPTRLGTQLLWVALPSLPMCGRRCFSSPPLLWRVLPLLLLL